MEPFLGIKLSLKKLQFNNKIVGTKKKQNIKLKKKLSINNK